MLLKASGFRLTSKPPAAQERENIIKKYFRALMR